MSNFTVVDFRKQPCLMSAARNGQGAVLIVDENENSRQSLSRRVQKQGLITMVAASGSEGLRLARRQRPALVLVALDLPDVDGIEWCQALADSPETCTIPLIALGRAGEPDLLARSQWAGCQFYLREPYDPRVLMALVRQAIDEAATWDGDEAACY